MLCTPQCPYAICVATWQNGMHRSQLALMAFAARPALPTMLVVLALASELAVDTCRTGVGGLSASAMLPELSCSRKS